MVNKTISIQGSRVMVLGGAGFLGSFLCERLIACDIGKLIIVDDFSLGTESNIQGVLGLSNVTVWKTDASNYNSMLGICNYEKPDVVFNLAVTPLPASLVKPKESVDTNILITSVACELLRKEKYKTLIHISSSEAYGTAIYVDKSMDENHPTSPKTPYAASKLACDHIALSYHKTFGSDVSIVRPFNMYGPRQNRKSYAGVIPVTIDRIKGGRSPIIHGDGLQTRDYSYVQDVANVIPRFYENTITRGKVINIASGKEITIKKIIFKIMDIMNYTGNVIYSDPRLGDVRRHCGDVSLARELLKYKPPTSFEDGLKKTVEWFM